MASVRDNESVGELISRLVADGRSYISAEIGVYRQKALAWVPPIRAAAVLLVVALLLAQAAITALLVGIGFWLSRWIGPLGGGAATALLGLAIAGILAKLAITKLTTVPAGGRA